MGALELDELISGQFDQILKVHVQMRAPKDARSAPNFGGKLWRTDSVKDASDHLTGQLYVTAVGEDELLDVLNQAFVLAIVEAELVLRVGALVVKSVVTDELFLVESATEVVVEHHFELIALDQYEVL